MDACRRTVSSYSDICRPIRGPHDTWEHRAVAYLSHACAILACALAPTLITFIGRMPGMMGGGSQATSGCCSVYPVSRVLGRKTADQEVRLHTGEDSGRSCAVSVIENDQRTNGALKGSVLAQSLEIRTEEESKGLRSISVAWPGRNGRLRGSHAPLPRQSAR